MTVDALLISQVFIDLNGERLWALVAEELESEVGVERRQIIEHLAIHSDVASNVKFQHFIWLCFGDNSWNSSRWIKGSECSQFLVVRARTFPVFLLELYQHLCGGEELSNSERSLFERKRLILFTQDVVSLNDNSQALYEVEENTHPEDGRESAAHERAEVSFAFVEEHRVVFSEGTFEDASSAAE